MGFLSNTLKVATLVRVQRLEMDHERLLNRVRDLEKNMGTLEARSAFLVPPVRVQVAEAVRLILGHLKLELRPPSGNPGVTLVPSANWKANYEPSPVPEKPKCSCGCVCQKG